MHSSSPITVLSSLPVLLFAAGQSQTWPRRVRSTFVSFLDIPVNFFKGLDHLIDLFCVFKLGYFPLFFPFFLFSFCLYV